MTAMSFTALSLVCAIIATATSAAIKREIPHSGELDFHGLNSIEEYGHGHGHHEHFHIPPPPAYSTISFVQTHHSKPTSYSGFTNHGRGHFDPGYAIEFRSDGFEHPHHHYGSHHYF